MADLLYPTSDEAFHALLSDPNLHAAGGGQILKHENGYSIRLFTEPLDETGSLFFELNPSANPKETWKWVGVTFEARDAFRKFAENPENGRLINS